MLDVTSTMLKITCNFEAYVTAHKINIRFCDWSLKVAMLRLFAPLNNVWLLMMLEIILDDQFLLPKVVQVHNYQLQSTQKQEHSAD